MTNAQISTVRTAIANGEPIGTRRFLRYCLETGANVHVAYGMDDVQGWVLSVTKNFAEIQGSETGAIRRISIDAMHETVEI